MEIGLPFAGVELGAGMANQFLAWMSAGVVAAGVSAAAVAGAGGARAYVLPAHQFTFIDLIVEKALESLQVLDFAYCAEDPSAISAATSKCSVGSQTQI